MKEDIKELKEEVLEVKNKSFAMELLEDYKKANKRMYVIVIMLIISLLLNVGYLVYVLNDIGTTNSETITQEVESNENSTINQNVGK